jgi:hypothetical protein
MIAGCIFHTVQKRLNVLNYIESWGNKGIKTAKIAENDWMNYKNIINYEIWGHGFSFVGIVLSTLKNSV